MKTKKIVPGTVPQNGDRIIYKLNGETTVDYIEFESGAPNYTVAETEGRWPLAGLKWHEGKRAWLRDKTKDQKPARGGTKPPKTAKEAPVAPVPGKGSLRVDFELAKPTKNAVQYKEVVTPGGAALVGTLYLQKSIFGSGKPPKRVTVDIHYGVK